MEVKNEPQVNNVIEFKKFDQPNNINETTVLHEKIILKEDLPLTAHNRKIQMGFLRKLYSAVIIQTLVTMIILILMNYLKDFKEWLELPNRGITCFGVGMGIIVTMSLIVTFAPLCVRNVYISFCFLSMFGICLGFVVGGLGSSVYMLTEYGIFIMFLMFLFGYTFYVEVEFNFWKNYIVGCSMSVIYLVVIDGVVLTNWLAAGCLIAGAFFFDFYAIIFSQFIIARNAEMFRIGDWIFGALKFNVDMGDVMMKIALDFLLPVWNQWRKKPVVVNKDGIFKSQNTNDKDNKVQPTFIPENVPLPENKDPNLNKRLTPEGV